MQQDYLLRLIEQFVNFLSQIAGLKEKRDFKKALEIINEAYGSLLKTDKEAVMGYTKEELIEKFNMEQLNIIADLFFEEGEIIFGEEKSSSGKTMMEKALDLYFYLNKKQKTYFIERETKINKIKIYLGLV